MQIAADQWIEYSISFLVGNSREGGKIDTYQYLAGAGYKLDWWMFSSRYLGINLAVSTGVQHQQDYRLMFSSQLIFDYKPLLGIDYAVLPRWLAIPLNIILPFQVGVKADYIWGRPPIYYVGRVIDLVY
jgi:hypothetical protein